MFKRLLSLSMMFAIPVVVHSQTTRAANQEKAAGEIYKLAGPSVVLIETYSDDGKVSGTGSGFLVTDNGKTLTNFHVIEHTKRASVRLANEDAYDTVNVLDVDKRKDIALLKIKAVSLPYLKLGHSSTAQVGDKLYTLGNPLGVFQNTLSEGLLSGIRQMDGYKMFQLSAPISHGSSGSPVFNAQGDVIGIVEALVSEGQNLNFAIPIDYAAGMLDSTDVQPLSAYYEPEETKEAAKPPEATAEATPNKEQASATKVSASMKQDAVSYVATKLGIWTKEDAELELGKPIDRRDGIMNNSVFADIYKYNSPTSNFSSIELSINRADKRVRAAYFYYASAVSWRSVEEKLGRNYKKQKSANGRPFYIYTFQGHTLAVLLDSANNVYNFGIW